MSRDLALFLRSISNVPMQPLRERLEALGLCDVVSYGMSGNFVFRSPEQDRYSLERRVQDAFGVAAFVRSRSELHETVAADPYRGEPGASMFLTHQALEREQEAVLDGLEFEGARPVVGGSVVYFVHPTRLASRRSVFDFERVLGLEGTMRASRVVGRLLDLMKQGGV